MRLRLNVYCKLASSLSVGIRRSINPACRSIATARPGEVLIDRFEPLLPPDLSLPADDADASRTSAAALTVRLNMLAGAGEPSAKRFGGEAIAGDAHFTAFARLPGDDFARWMPLTTTSASSVSTFNCCGEEVTSIASGERRTIFGLSLAGAVLLLLSADGDGADASAAVNATSVDSALRIA